MVFYIAIIFIIITTIGIFFFAINDNNKPASKKKRYLSVKNKITPIFENKEKYIILDCETTGFTKNSEIIEIAILSLSGDILLNQRIMPKGRIPSDATKVHGITRKMLKGCPSWPDIMEEVSKIISGKTVIAYNSEFDIRLLKQTGQKWDCSIIVPQQFCLMKIFAEYEGDWNDYRKDYKWHKLTKAANNFNIDKSNVHSAKADCEMTRKLLFKIKDAVL